MDFLRYPPHPYATPAPLQACPPTSCKTGSSRGPRPIECRNGDRQPRRASGRRGARGSTDVGRGTAPELDSSEPRRRQAAELEETAQELEQLPRPIAGPSAELEPCKIVERSTTHNVGVSLAPSRSRPLLFAAVTPQPREGSPLRRWKHDRNYRRRRDCGPTARPADPCPSWCTVTARELSPLDLEPYEVFRTSLGGYTVRHIETARVYARTRSARYAMRRAAELNAAHQWKLEGVRVLED